MWRRRAKQQIEVHPVADDFREWVANMPYVVERPSEDPPTVRTYDVDCDPLGRRGTWLVLDFESPGAARPKGIVAILPSRLARKASRAGWGHFDPPTLGDEHERDLADRVLFHVNPLADRQHVETVVLGAYRSIIDWT